MQPQSQIRQTKRITEIDALRAFVLLGIILVHTASHFGYGDIPSIPETKLSYTIWRILDSRCAPLFNLLFGCSFYLILKNPLYPAGKFVWRCILLILIGMISRIFYASDILIWYGLMGCILVLFKNLNTSRLLIVCVTCWMLTNILSMFKLGYAIFGEEQEPLYSETSTMHTILNYPLYDNITYLLRNLFNQGILGSLTLMIAGYYLAKKGIIYRLRELANKRVIITLLLIYATCRIITSIFWHYDFKDNIIYTINLSIFNYSGAALYAMLFICVYLRFEHHLRWMEQYGKLGLTNYFFQGIAGIILFTTVFKPMQMPFAYILLTMTGFYAAQTIFSIIWLKYHKYGPLEGLWRKATDLYSIMVTSKPTKALD